MKEGRFTLVHALRGLAALWVVLFHVAAAGHISGLRSQLPPLTDHIFTAGHLGVAIFFALSGFVITHSVAGASITASYLGRFALRRSIRLDPPYWASILFVVGVGYLSAHVKGEAFQPPELPTDAGAPVLPADFARLSADQLGLLDPDLRDPILPGPRPADHGRAEDAHRPAAHRAPALPGDDGLLVRPDDPADGAVRRSVARLSRWGACILGENQPAGALRLRRRLRAVVGLVAQATSRSSASARRSCCHVAFRTGYIYRGLDWRWVQFLGTVSYSLYLIHNPIVGGVSFLTARWIGSDLVTLILSVAASIAAAAAFWYLLERPSLALAHRIRMKKAEQATSVMSDSGTAAPKSQNAIGELRNQPLDERRSR